MIPIAKPILGNEEISAVTDVLKSGMIAQGKEVELFEREFCEYHNVKYGLAVSNGTTALDVALKSLKVSSGDEVITTPFTFIASSNCILYQGAKTVFADIDEKTFNIDPNEVLENINSKTKAIIAVHLYGQPADMKALREIADDHKLFLIEDAAQAHGAEFEGKKIGNFGDITTFSFYPTKNMTSSEGGMVVTNNPEIAKISDLIRNHGQAEKYLHTALGYNFRMTNISAAIGRVQLKKVEEWTEKRIKNAKELSKRLSKIDGLSIPYLDKRVRHVFHQYVLRVEADFSLSRDEFSRYLNENGVGTGIHYPIPVHNQPVYQNLGYDKDECPNSIDAAKKVLSLPVHPSVSLDDIEYITQKIENRGGVN
ncbi:DegT/DnrJ/EryC1/StrS family aminotransferase [Methanococcus maripaludis]|uniref:DegT/DnrJ/EryC1/StrS aminotransferase n=1 Tax=Methanococcus maripaludis (strain DSM 14266 / JCM 13030 / NBRC 101832 / S2 / LL) TaxID=267377 RepID=Q6M0C0_METMP|nr:DegT/DnrJ/EryC1/StrS family aminotransferase [Methanococcus maripaludis]CAF29907.1 DegT/DnrJ/EryC1/StrS aminotransferase [Methanococcus maripaludis S2]